MQNESSTVNGLVFSAHPDDAEMAMGGTMLRFVAAGLRLHHVCLTRGGMGTFGDVAGRSAEFIAAQKAIGCTGEQLELPDLGIENSRQNRILVAEIIRFRRPEIIFAPYHTNDLGELGGISNVDHYTSGALIRDAVKFARLQKTVPHLDPHTVHKLYFYMLPRNILPTLFVDISPVINRYREVLKCYASQMAIRSGGVEIEHRLLLMRQSLGLQIGKSYAEGFVTDMPLQFEPATFLAV